jgi:hypothetical protein
MKEVHQNTNSHDNSYSGIEGWEPSQRDNEPVNQK